MTEPVNNLDAWGTETGLVDDYILTIEESFFATDARYNSGQTLLMHWKGKAVDDDGVPVGETGEVELLIPCGNGWESNDGGKTAVHEKGKTKFNSSSVYGSIVDRAIKQFDMADVLASRGLPTQGDVWTGLKFRIKTEEINYGGEIGTKKRQMPQEYLGVADGVSAPAAQATSTPAATPAAGGAGTDKVLEAKVKQAAKTAADHASFVDAAMAIDGVVENDALLARVVDDSPAGIYAEARA